MSRLTDWLAVGGARFPSLCLRTYGDGERGAHAQTAIRKGEIVLEVPPRLILTGQAAWISAIGQQIASAGAKREDSHSFLAAYLLQERQEAGSFWSPYIETLPSSFSQTPLFFGLEELALLAGSFILAKIEERRAALVEEYQDLRRHVAGLDRFTLQEFIWAHLIVSSRCFGMKIYGRETYGLVPMADMLNHKAPPETAWAFDDSAGRFILTALRDFAAGDAVHDSYGRKCNSEFLLHHGFCLEENDENRTWIRFGESATSFGDASFAARAFCVPASPFHEDTRKMLSSLRLACADGDDSPHPAGGASEEIGPVSPANETRTLLALAAACTDALGRFPTSLEEDEMLLQNPELSRNARNAILMRRGEKRVLCYFLGLAEAAVPWLRKPLSELAQAATEHRFGAGPYADYLRALAASLTSPAPGA